MYDLKLVIYDKFINIMRYHKLKVLNNFSSSTDIYDEDMQGQAAQCFPSSSDYMEHSFASSMRFLFQRNSFISRVQQCLTALKFEGTFYYNRPLEQLNISTLLDKGLRSLFISYILYNNWILP